MPPASAGTGVRLPFLNVQAGSQTAADINRQREGAWSLPTFALPGIPGFGVSTNRAAFSLRPDLDLIQQQAAQSGQAAHNQLIGFGQNTADNLNWAGNAANNAWMDFHHAFDGYLDNGHSGLIQFGKMVEGMLGRVSPVLAGLWSGFQRQVDKDIDTGKQRLESFGNMIGGNIQHGSGQVGATWGNIRDNVDRPLHQGLGSAQRPFQQSNAGASLSAPNLNVNLRA